MPASDTQTGALELQQILREPSLPGGVSLLQASQEQPLLVVLLRHSGCTFCRETLAKLAGARTQIEHAKARLVLVHMGEDSEAAVFFAKYNLEREWRISDPTRRLYRAFGLRKGKLSQVLGLRVFLRGFLGGALWKHGMGIPRSDAFQLPGSFLLHRGCVIRSHVPASAADEAAFEVNQMCAL
jgi:peroxiredoxin